MLFLESFLGQGRGIGGKSILLFWVPVFSWGHLFSRINWYVAQIVCVYTYVANWP